MNVEKFIELLKTMPLNLQVVMPDMIPITQVIYYKNYGDGVVIITDAEECEHCERSNYGF